MTYKDHTLKILKSFLSKTYTEKEINKMFGNWNHASSTPKRKKIISETITKIETLFMVTAAYKNGLLKDDQLKQLIENIYEGIDICSE